MDLIHKSFAIAGILMMAVACNQAPPKTVNSLPDSTTVIKSNAFSIAPMVKDYLALKNALATSNGAIAADAGKRLLNDFTRVDMAAIPADKHSAYMDIAEDAKVNAEHIGANAGKIEHQREHFAALSKDLNDLILLFDAPQQLYLDSCPMYDDGKGAIWLSETSEIRNPYFGEKMPACGSVKKEYQHENHP